MTLGEDDKAIADYSQAIALNPQSAKAYYNRAFAWTNKGDEESAVKDFVTALRLDPSVADLNIQ